MELILEDALLRDSNRCKENRTDDTCETRHTAVSPFLIPHPLFFLANVSHLSLKKF